MSNDYYCGSIEHILAELERIDLLVRAQVSRARSLQETDSEFQGLYISEKEVDALLEQSAGMPRWAEAPLPLSLDQVRAAVERMAADIDRRKAGSSQRKINLRFEELTHVFKLDPFEVDTLLIGLAPEIDLRYERLYAYLHDDVTKKRPSVDLVLNLLSPSFKAKQVARRYFADESALRKYHLLHLFDDPTHHNPPLLNKFLKVDERIVNYLYGSDELDASLGPSTKKIMPGVQLNDLILPKRTKERLGSILRNNGAGDPTKGMVFYFQGKYGIGKQSLAEALCLQLGIGLLSINCEYLLNPDGLNFEKMLQQIIREALLQNAALYWSSFDALLGDDKHPSLVLLLNELEKWRGLSFLAGETTWEPMDALHDVPFIRIEIPLPTYDDRVRLWMLSLNGNTSLAADVNPEALANKFRFSGGQIIDSAATARNLARWRDHKNGNVSMADLHRACRLQSNRKLATLAQKITPHYRWDDIVLPTGRFQQLREICNYVKYHALVYEQWGFDAKLSLGKGLNALFAGPSGTGKTMAAEIMAGELGLDLYKIDLSTVVSKYIGETEKNLARIFIEAETSNAILFFDEADALFGKRSEVRDAHDRYANIEISYLLQKMEEYEGIVILATNFRKNMDDAFVRRIHFTVDFPFPSEKDRRRIWEKIWPEKIPLDPDIELGFMARHFEIAGGNIRNVALAASFLAADDGAIITMAHLIRATRREFQKMGKVVTEGEFGKYASMAAI